MARKRKIVILFFLICSIVKPQTIINRFKVPIKLKSNFAIGYDDNYLRLSNRDLRERDLDMIGGSGSASSYILKPSIYIDYSPVILDKKITSIKSSITYSYFNKSIHKSYLISRILMETKLKSYSWLRFGIRYIPKYYLRNFLDRDMSNVDFYECAFSSTEYFSNYSFPLKRIKRAWVKLYFGFTQEYYNPSFTEFDLNKSLFQITINKRLKNKSKLKFEISNGYAKNISYGSSLLSASFNRSYTFDRLRGDFNWYIKKNKLIKNILLSIQLEQRYYSLESVKYASDNWKYYIDGKMKIKMDWDFSDIYGVSTLYQYRFRDASSRLYGDFEWVDGAKSYSKHEVWLEFSYKFVTDILY
jgi:hypothetical protein